MPLLICVPITMEDLYRRAFEYLETGKRFESASQFADASIHYEYGCQVLRTVHAMEPNVNKKNLLIDQISYFENLSRSLRQRASPPQKSPIKKAEELFSQALSLEESGGDLHHIEALYLEAAELYMNELKREKNPTIESRVTLILDRVTEIKATKSNLTAVKNLQSIDPCRPLQPRPPKIEITVSPIEDKKVSEVIPLSSSAPPSPELSSEEISVLRASSIINGRCFHPWLEGEEKRETFRFHKPFSDPDGPLTLSTSQRSKNATYIRASELLGSRAVMIRQITPLSITQDLVEDCSFVCSLCIAAAFEARHGKKLLTAIIYPQDNRGVPIYNPSGKYLVKLFMNGVYRKVVVDDFLPVISTERGNRMLCSCSRDPSELWVSILEKAYMKLSGGYNFPGSNSGIDLFSLTGWIPEQIFFEEDAKRVSTSSSSSSTPTTASAVNRPSDFRQSEDRVWERILSAHRFGDCLITISTGPLSPEEEAQTGLVRGHAYAVLNIQQAGILRMLQVKNPWARHPWLGRFSSSDRARWTPGLKQALGVKDEDFDKMDEEGLFWIEFSDCRTYFKSFFLNCTESVFLLLLFSILLFILFMLMMYRESGTLSIYIPSSRLLASIAWPENGYILPRCESSIYPSCGRSASICCTCCCWGVVSPNLPIINRVDPTE
jgi:hypothetical protein